VHTLPTETTPTKVEAARRIERERKKKDTKEDRQGGGDTDTERQKKIAWKKIFQRQIGRRRDRDTRRGLVSVYRGLVSV